MVQLSPPPPPPLKAWESEGSRGLNSIIFRESLKVLHGKCLYGVDVSGWLYHQAEGGHSCVKAWWQLHGEEPKNGESQSEVPLCWCTSQIPAMCLVMLSTNSLTQLGRLFFCSVCKPFCVAGTGPSALCLSFPIWAEGLVWVCFCSGVQWRAVQSSTLKSSDEKHQRRTEAY